MSTNEKQVQIDALKAAYDQKQAIYKECSEKAEEARFQRDFAYSRRAEALRLKQLAEVNKATAYQAFADQQDKAHIFWANWQHSLRKGTLAESVLSQQKSDYEAERLLTDAAEQTWRWAKYDLTVREAEWDSAEKQVRVAVCGWEQANQDLTKHGSAAHDAWIAWMRVERSDQVVGAVPPDDVPCNVRLTPKGSYARAEYTLPFPNKVAANLWADRVRGSLSEIFDIRVEPARNEEGS